MPSSSKRSTNTEAKLYYYFRQAYNRLYFAWDRHASDFIRDAFAKALDMTPHELMDRLHADWKMWNAMTKDCDRLCRSDKILQAGTACADTGVLLEKIGRLEEATEYCGWANELWDMAVAAYQQEKGSQSNGVQTVMND